MQKDGPAERCFLAMASVQIMYRTICFLEKIIANPVKIQTINDMKNILQRVDVQRTLML
jgi:hypothetical protein